VQQPAPPVVQQPVAPPVQPAPVAMPNDDDLPF
jgi:hypothetical protein